MDSVDVLNSKGNLFLNYYLKQPPPEACKLGEGFLKKILGDDYYIDTLCDIQDLSIVSSAQRRFTEAFDLEKEVLERRTWVQGEDRPGTLLCIGNVAAHLWNQGRLLEVEKLFNDEWRNEQECQEGIIFCTTCVECIPLDCTRMQTFMSGIIEPICRPLEYAKIVITHDNEPPTAQQALIVASPCLFLDSHCSLKRSCNILNPLNMQISLTQKGVAISFNALGVE